MSEPKRSRGRRYTRPRWGTGLYELFNYGIFMTLGPLLIYVLTGTTPTQRQALYGPLSYLPDFVWGLLLSSAGLFALVCSLRVDGSWFDAGRYVLRGAAFFWSLAFLFGTVLFVVKVVFNIEDPESAGMLRDVIGRGLYSFLLYGLVWSGLQRTKVPS